MSTVHVTPDHVEIRLSPAAEVADLLADLVVSRPAVAGVEVLPDGTRAAHGARAPGLGLSGVARTGIRRGWGDMPYVARRGQRAPRLALDGERHDTAVVGTDDAGALAARLGEEA